MPVNDATSRDLQHGRGASFLLRKPSLGELIILMTLVIAPLVAIIQFVAYYRYDVVDDQMFAYFGWRIAHGGTVYLDVWDNKPPGIYWINAVAMWLGNDSYYAVIAMCVLALLVSFVAFFVICNTLYHRGVAALGTVLFSFFVTHIFFTGGTNRTETFLVASELAAVAFYLRGYVRDGWWKWFVAGVLCGAAFTFKQVGLVAWGAMGLHLILLRLCGGQTTRDLVRRGSLLVGGLLAAIAAAVLLLLIGGGWRGVEAALFATFGFNQAYFDRGHSQFPYNYLNWYLLKQHFWPILQLPLLMAVAALLHASVWFLSPSTRPRDIAAKLDEKKTFTPMYPVLIMFAAWFAVAFYGAMLSPHAFRHYLVPTIPPLLLLATYIMNVLKGEYTLMYAMQRSAWATVAFVGIAYFGAEAVARQWEEFAKTWVFRFEKNERAEWEVIAEVVRAATDEDDKIQCWGYFPGVYLHARRLNTCRFTTTEKVGQVREGASFVLDELVETLYADPPVVIVVSSEDYEWMYGRLEGRPAPEVNIGGWIDENYTRIADLSLTYPTYVYKRDDVLRESDYWEGYRPPAELKAAVE